MSDGEKPAGITVELDTDLIYVEDGNVVFWSMSDRLLYFSVVIPWVTLKAVLEQAKLIVKDSPIADSGREKSIHGEVAC